MELRRGVSRVAVPLAIAAAALMAASTAWACTIIAGQTRINGATTSSTRAGYLVPKVTGDGVPTGSPYPAEGVYFDIVASNKGTCCASFSYKLATGVKLVRANTPDLGPRDVRAPTRKASYWICYYYSSGNFATNPATLSVL